MKFFRTPERTVTRKSLILLPRCQYLE